MLPGLNLLITSFLASFAVAAPTGTSSVSDSKVQDGAAFSKVVTVMYRFSCDIGGLMQREMKIKVNFNGDKSNFENVSNAEKFSEMAVYHTGPASYEVEGVFNHGTCVPFGFGRKCGYSISATLVANANDRTRQYTFDTPMNPGYLKAVPVVIETCSAPGNLTGTCPSSGGTRCKVRAITVE